MEHKIKAQRGYLLILATVLILIATFVGSLLVNMFMGKTVATHNNAQASAAFYLANSGMEIVKRDIAVNHLMCTGMNGTAKYTNAALLSGTFTVTGTSYLAQSTLASAVGASDSSIPITNVANFASNGVALVGNEHVQYVGISGNTLLNAVRGVFGSVAATHALGTSVTQDQCLLTSVGGVPNLTSPDGKRTIQQALLGRIGFHYDSSIPAMVSGGAVALQGTPAVINPSVTTSSFNFPGSTVVSSGTVTIGGAATTQVSNGSGGLAVSSSKTGLAGDVVQNYSGAAASGLFNVFFNATEAQVQATATTVISTNITSSNFSTLNGHAGETVWLSGNINVNGGSVTIGTSSNPVMFIINGNVSLGGNSSLTIYGVAYVTGTIATSGGGSLTGYGQIASESTINMQGGGTVNFDSSVLAILGLKEFTIIRYSGNAIGILQEVFP